MSKPIYTILIMSGVFAILFMALAFVSMIVGDTKASGRVYNCSLAEISPDFPPEVKNECRKLRSEAYKNGRI
jgi:hypothetical protein